MPSDLNRFDQLENRLRSGHLPVASKNWRAPILAGQRIWDIPEAFMIDAPTSEIACRCIFDVVDRSDTIFIQFIANFHRSAFESGEFSLEKREFIWLHARLHVREFLERNQQIRARSRGERAVVFDYRAREDYDSDH